MGSIVNAVCKCGYEKELFIGGGMSNFETVCHFPSYCQNCNDLVQTNLYEKTVKCPQCKSEKVVAYDQKELISKLGMKVVCCWNTFEELGRVIALTNGNYLCPSCSNNRLKFYKAGNWD
tara:strand:+ start:544 stop:900 length:357 start_codon:yes stop_codon:yes gene_type:complete